MKELLGYFIFGVICLGISFLSRYEDIKKEERLITEVDSLRNVINNIIPKIKEGEEFYIQLQESPSVVDTFILKRK